MKKVLLVLLLLGFIVKSSGQNMYIQTNFPNGNCPPAAVSFEVKNPIALAKVFHWYFDDGFDTIVINQANVNHSFSIGGYHYCYVHIYDASMGYLTYLSGNANMGGINFFNVSPGSGYACPNDNINFYAGYNGSNGSFSWNYGDGSPVTNGNMNYANHAYVNPGTYTVTLISTVGACPTTTTTATVSIGTNNPVDPNMHWFASSDSICKNDLVQFHFAKVPSYYLDFGDGTSTTSEKSHSYAYNGNFPVSLTVMNGCGNSYTFSKTISVIPNLPVTTAPVFYPDAYQICPNTELSFKAPVGYNNYNWTFGNGNTSTVMNPRTTYYNTGTYPVTLSVTNGCGNSRSFTDTVDVVNNLQVGTVSLYMADTLCPGSAVFTNIYADQATSYSFNFGYNNNQTYYSPANGIGLNKSYVNNQQILVGQAAIQYDSIGTFIATVTATNGCGNSASMQKTIRVLANSPINPNAFDFGIPSYQNCVSDTTFAVIGPAEIGTYSINFGDGSPVVTQPNMVATGPAGIKYAIFKHKYASIGTYTATATVMNSCGNSTVKTKTVNVSNSASLQDAGLIFDEFKYNCLQDPVYFIGAGASRYTIDFGDGSPTETYNSFLVTFSHKYANSGLYKIKTILENTCGAKDTSIAEINIQHSFMNISTNSVSSSCGLATGKAIASVSTGANPPYTFKWTNGDNIAIADSVSAGIYEVTVTDSKGCQDRAIATVSDAQAPSIVLNTKVDVTCKDGNDGLIDINIIGGSQPVTYAWSNGKTTQDISNCVAGPYEVIVTDAAGCKSAKSFKLNEPNGFNATFQIVKPSCGSSNGSITTTMSPPASNYNFIWTSPQFTGVMTTQNLSNLQAGVYNVTVIDGSGCLRDFSVTLGNIGGPKIGVDSITSINCMLSGSQVYTSEFPTVLQPGPFTYLWKPGNYTTPDVSGLSGGTYTLQVSGNGNCKTYYLINVNDKKMKENPICAVTVDSITYTNKVVWEEVSQPNLASYNIYRESSQAGHYFHVANVHKDSLHEWIDPVADPSIRGWRYKITAVSTCGVESERSQENKTIHLTVNKGIGTNYNLIWDNYIGKSVPTYFIWRYSNSNGWEKIDSVPSNLTSYTDINPPVAASHIDYMIEGGPLSICDPTRGPINTTRSNIKNARMSPTGIANTELSAFGIRVYPNPSNGNISVALSKPFENKAQLEVWSSLGQKLLNTEIQKNELDKQIDLNALGNGIYFIKIISSEGQFVNRIIIQK